MRTELARFDRDFHLDFNGYEDAAALERALRKRPNDPSAHAAWSLYLLGENRFDDAERSAKRALAIDPKHAHAHFALTRVALEDRDALRAELHLRSILATGQDGYVIRVLLARAALAGGRADAALPEAEAAIAIDPDQLEAHRVLLDIAEIKRDPALGRRALKALAQIDQHDRALHLALLGALADDKRYPELLEAAERAVYLAPDSAEVHRYWGEALLHTGEPKKAMVELDRALELGHRRPARVHALRVRALLLLRKQGPAQKALEEAVKLEPGLRGELEALIAR
jgi:tetratricopeptide (TPR) repeat protein